MSTNFAKIKVKTKAELQYSWFTKAKTIYFVYLKQPRGMRICPSSSIILVEQLWPIPQIKVLIPIAVRVFLWPLIDLILWQGLTPKLTLTAMNTILAIAYKSVKC